MSARAFLVGRDVLTLQQICDRGRAAIAWASSAQPGDSTLDGAEEVTCISTSLACAIGQVLNAYPEMTADELREEGAALLADDVLAFGALLLA